MTLQAWRRAGVVVFAVLVAALLLRGQIADSLVVRGDELNYRGDAQRALAKYELAAGIDPTNITAVDRSAFVALRINQAGTSHKVLAMAERALASSPTTIALRQDRALLLLKLRRYDEAKREFERVGALAHDAQAYTFAGFAARHAGRVAAARQDFKLAVAIDPAFKPATVALARTRR